MKTLYVQASKGTQSLDYTEYAEHAGARWRVQFRHDFYAHQSSGVAERWDGTQWQEVFTCSPARLKLGAYSTIMEPHLWEGDAGSDAEYMVTMAAMVVGDTAGA